MKTNLVTIQEAKVVTSSLQVSQTFGKNHQHVIRDVENLKRDVSNFGQMFLESSYLDSYNRKQRMYVINRNGFTLLAMGFTGKKALQFKIDYINAFNRMEEYIKNQSAQPTLPRRKATGRRVETYLPSEDLLRLQIAAHEEKYNSVYHLLQDLIYCFLENPRTSPYEKVKKLEKLAMDQALMIARLTEELMLVNEIFDNSEESDLLKTQLEESEKERNTWRQLYEERKQFVEYMRPFIQKMNRTIDEERTLRKKYEAKLRQIKQLA